jgi:hypothetical protein
MIVMGFFSRLKISLPNVQNLFIHYNFRKTEKPMQLFKPLFYEHASLLHEAPDSIHEPKMDTRLEVDFVVRLPWRERCVVV